MYYVSSGNLNFFFISIVFLLLSHKVFCFTSVATANVKNLGWHRKVNIHRSKTLLDKSSKNIQNIEPYIEQSHGANPGGVTVVVVGGGVGGLACASRIAYSCRKDLQRSTKVVLLEKNSKEKIGGRCGSFYRDVDGVGRFRHDRGPSLLLLKDVYLDLFRDCDKRAADFGLEFRQCVPAYQVVFDDGDTITLGFPRTLQNADNGQLKIEEQKSRGKLNSFEKNGALKWDEYMQITEAFLNCGLPNFIEEDFDISSFPSFLKEALKDGMKVSFK